MYSPGDYWPVFYYDTITYYSKHLFVSTYNYYIRTLKFYDTYNN